VIFKFNQGEKNEVIAECFIVNDPSESDDGVGQKHSDLDGVVTGWIPI